MRISKMESQLAKGGNSDPMNTARFSNRAARFYWAEEEPSPQRAYSIQQIGKSSSHFEESPLVIAAISAGVIGVAIIIIILVGIWIRSRLYSEVEGRASQHHPNNMSARSSTSTLEEEAYIVCMEMDGGTVLGSMHNASDNYCENSATTLEMENEKSAIHATPVVPEIIEVDSFSESSSHVIQTIAEDASESNAKSSVAAE